MAGDSYRGLTIKIGADATPLAKELKRVESAANSAQKDLRKLDKALKLDPGNLGVMNKRIDALGSSARATSEKVGILGRSVRQAYREMTTSNPSKSFKDLDNQLKKNGESASAYAARMRASFDRVNEQIAKYRANILKAEGININGHTKGWLKDTYNQLIQNSDIAKKYSKEIERVNQMGAQSANLNAKLIDADQLANIKKAEVELQSENAKVRSLSNSFVIAREEYSRFANQSGITKASEAVKEYAASSQQARVRVDELNRAMAEAPATPGLAAERYDTLQYALKEDQNLLGAMRSEIVSIKAAMDNEGIERVNASLAELQRREQAAGSAASAARQAYDSQKGTLTSLGEKYDALRMKLNAHYDGSEIMNSADLARTKSQLQACETVMNSMSPTVDKLRDKVKTAQAAFNGAVLNRTLKESEQNYKTASAAAAAYAQKSTKSARDWTKGAYMMRSIGTSLYSTITPAATMAAYGVINSTDQIDAAYRDMRKTVDGTDSQFETLKKSAIDFSKTHVTSADQILEIQAIGGQLGVATDDLGKFAETVSNIDVATNINSEDAAEGLGKLGSVTKMTSDDYEHFGDSLVRLGNKFPGQESDIMDITTRFAGMAQTVGMSRTDMLAWATAATATGQKSEAAGSAMQRFIGYIEGSVGKYDTAVKEGKKGSIEFADIAGKSAKTFAKEWKSNPTEAMRDVLLGLVKLKKEGGSVDGWIQANMSKNVRDRQLIEGLVNSYGKYTDAQGDTAKGFTILDSALDESADAWKRGGDANAEATKKAQGFSGQLSILKNNAQDFASDVGNSLTPALGAANDVLTTVSSGYQGLSEGWKNAINLAGGFAIAVGPVLTGLGTMGQGITSVKNGLDNATVSYLKSKRGFTQVDGALKAAGISSELFTDATVLQQSAMGNNGREMQKASRIAKGLTVANKAATAGLIGLAIGGVAFAGTQIYSYVKDMQNAKSVSEGLIDTQGQVTDSAKQTGKGYVDIKGQVTNTTSALANMKTEFQNQQEGFNQSSALVDNYVAKIDELTEKAKHTKLTGTEQQELQTAVEGYNKATGSTISVIDAVKGKLSDSTKEIDKQADAWKRNAQAQVYSQQLQTMAAQQVTAQQQYLDALNKFNEIDAKARSGQPFSYEEYKQAGEALKQAGQNLTALNLGMSVQNAALTANKNGLDQYVSSNQKMVSSLQGGSAAAGSFSTYLAQMGISQKELKKSSEETAQGYVDSYNAIAGTGANVNYVAAALTELGMKQSTLANTAPADAAKLGNAYNAMAAKGQSVQSLQTSLEQLGVTQAQISSLTPGAVATMINSYDGTTGSIENVVGKLSQLKGIVVSSSKLPKIKIEATDDGSITKIHGLVINLDKQTIGDKKFDVTSNGSVKMETGYVINLKKMTIDGKKFHVTSDGTIKTEEGKIIDLDKEKVKDKSYKVSSKGSKEAKKDMDDLDKKSKKPASKKVSAKSDGSVSKTKKDMDDLDKKSKKTATKNVKAKSSGFGGVKKQLEDIAKQSAKTAEKKVKFSSSGYGSVKGQIAELSGNKTIGTKTIVFKYETVGKKPGGSMAGGIARYGDLLKGAVTDPMAYRYMKSHNLVRSAHAEGGIVTRATMTRAGWVGENGAEAIVPLDNKHYVRPFARAVAQQIDTSGINGGGTTIINNYSIDGLQVAPESALAAAMDQVFSESERLGRM